MKMRWGRHVNKEYFITVFQKGDALKREKIAEKSWPPKS
jgi:hypothetical protein